jgi:uncharacterized protein involved in exopolysaccharide biosynthesis
MERGHGQTGDHGIGWYLDLLRRRRRQIVATAGALFLASLAVAFLLPAAYRSTATILIEEQEVPPDLVRSAITSYADQRIQTIKHQVMTRPNLWKIIEQYGLYEGLRRRSTTEDVLERMVDDIDVRVISAEVVDRRTNQPTKATIAFTLSYDGETPALAQKVANELTSLFLAENLRSRERHAHETTTFLQQEAERLAGHLEELEGRVATFKQQADGALPELTQLNMQLLNQAERELTDMDQRINALEERKAYLEGQLTIIKPHTPIVTSSGERILDAGERLKALRAQYASSVGYLSSDHPDIIRMGQEIEALERETGEGPDAAELRKRLTDERAKLATFRERYGDEHPDVTRTRTSVESLEQRIKELRRRPKQTVEARAENPAYISVQTQLASTTTELQALRATRGSLKRRADQYAGRVERTPELEPRYLDLNRDLDNSTKKYHDLRLRLLEAQVSEGLEFQRKGERFSLIDPPDLPEKPETPNRSAIIFLGLILAMAGGGGVGAAVESLDRSVRSADMLASIARVPPLAVIPYQLSETYVAQVGRRARIFGWACAGFLMLLLVLMHLFWLPLDVLWFLLLRRIGLN